MCPVHSANGRRPGHLAGGVPVHSIGRQYAHVVACTALIMTRVIPRKQPRDINTICTTDIRALGDLLGDTSVGYFYIIPSVMSLGPHVGAQHPCTCPPLSYKRGGTQRYRLKLKKAHLDLDPAQAHKFIQALKLNTSHSGVGYYAPAARTTLNLLCSCVLPDSIQHAKRLGPTSS